MKTDVKFIRLATPKEQNSVYYKRVAFLSFPELADYEKVYMSFGENGRGFYYSKKDVS